MPLGFCPQETSCPSVYISGRAQHIRYKPRLWGRTDPSSHLSLAQRWLWLCARLTCLCLWPLVCKIITQPVMMKQSDTWHIESSTRCFQHHCHFQELSHHPTSVFVKTCPPPLVLFWGGTEGVFVSCDPKILKQPFGLGWKSFWGRWVAGRSEFHIQVLILPVVDLFVNS